MNSKINQIGLTLCLAIAGFGCSQNDSDSSSISEQPPSWKHPTSLTDNISPDTTDARDPRPAQDESSNALIAWVQDDETGKFPNIYLSERRQGSWQHPADLGSFISPQVSASSSFNSIPSLRPVDVAMDNNGDAIVAWSQRAASTRQGLFVSEYRNGAWAHPTLNDYFFEYSGILNVDVDMADNGEALVTYYDDSSARHTIRYHEYRNGVWTGSNASLIHRERNRPQSSSMNNNGEAVIAYRHHTDTDVSEITIFEYRDGQWPEPGGGLVVPHGAVTNTKPSTAMIDDGTTIVVWAGEEDIGSGNLTPRLYKSEYRNGAWSHPSGSTDFFSPADSDDAGQPDVAMDQLGNAVVVWPQSDGTNQQIFMSEYRNGVWTHPQSLADNISPDGENASEPRVAMNAQGDAIIVWSQSNGADMQIYMSEFRAGVWQHPTDIQDKISVSGSSASQPQVIINDNGEVIIVWEQGDGANTQIFISEYR